ncbi:nicotinamidase [Listeria sp. PSOL-1]|uniref:nicotinamidase n=1 Tax=Listeria sp. PSOL-1 TaxID=1844999 RepID=UPI0013D8C07F|nr:nicotinamidase [Listeria sp. PSOL-1]
MKIATFDVDAQKGFTPLCPAELPVPEGQNIVEELNFMATLGEYRLGSKDAHPKNAVWVVEKPEEMLQPLDYKEADLTWVRHCEPGKPGFELLDGLPEPTRYNYFIWKGIERNLHPYGACYHDISENLTTGVLEYLQGQKVDLVLVGGLAFDFCVKTTVLQLHKAGFPVIVYLPATRALTEEGYDTTKRQLEEKGIRLANSRQELAEYCSIK